MECAFSLHDLPHYHRNMHLIALFHRQNAATLQSKRFEGFLGARCALSTEMKSQQFLPFYISLL